MGVHGYSWVLVGVSGCWVLVGVVGIVYIHGCSWMLWVLCIFVGIRVCFGYDILQCHE